MPEGDSVYRLAERLRRSLDGRVLRTGRLNVASCATADLAGRAVVGHDTWGKHLLTRFDGGLTLHTHLRMDGQWSVVRAGRRLPSRLYPDVRVHLATVDGPTAYGLRLPVVDLVPTADERQVVGHLGPDPLRADFDAADAVRRLGSDPERPVKAALLDQRLIAGLGNLWANELCFLRGLYPWTPVDEVDLVALVRLAARALRVSATVPGQYQVTTGNHRRGESHWVTGRAHRPCLRCGTPVRVRAETTTERRTWWCPRCQPA
ncbi:DNA-formamidopyrimidine glycosylase family protein [Jatrophihabitans endophyticus]|uniref:DNA-formamidopyrimidine glycosylase family protein n=1 Tax=Jatrophihabitans endophyticus TaxID=1206085 RepID=UPI0019F06728|nr:DNA-formamidopyrimidine glycosylase family protein [Jatrophihabitans endophyticus]MBE7190480.1 Fpg/Nei family DNA glycosylase [Jatrophihabitans endophyticus]